MNHYINKEWILSTTARRNYRFTAILSLVLLFVLFLFPYLDQIPKILIPVLKLAFLSGILGTAITFIAMEYFFFNFYEASPLKMIFWFLALGFPLIGPALYCFTVYSRTPVLSKPEPDPNLASRPFES